MPTAEEEEMAAFVLKDCARRTKFLVEPLIGVSMCSDKQELAIESSEQPEESEAECRGEKEEDEEKEELATEQIPESSEPLPFLRRRPPPPPRFESDRNADRT